MENGFRNYGVSEQIIKALDALEYTIPTLVQAEVIPLVLSGRDIVVKSKTGSGKTAAFGIPLCEKVVWDENYPQALVLTPTRELAVQIKEDIGNIGRLKRIKATAVFGKQPFSIQQRELKQRSHIVVGTPGRVLDHLDRGTLITEKISYLIIDEADEMLNMGFIDEMEAIIAKLPKNRVTMLFSATFPNDIALLCDKHMIKPLTVEVESEEAVVATISHYYITCNHADKLDILDRVILGEQILSGIIFARTQENVDMVYDMMYELNYSCGKIHGGMMQQERLDVMRAFRRGDFDYLVATDVAARGIDIEGITHIINYDIPLEKERYVHRTGRTGRAGKSGKAITLITPREDRFQKDIEEYIGFELKKMQVPSDEAVELGKSVLDEASDDDNRKGDRGAKLNENIVKLYIGSGKKNKLRAGDIVGAICSVDGVVADDIGIITILDYVAYVEILNGKGMSTLNALRKTKIKGKQMKIDVATTTI